MPAPTLTLTEIARAVSASHRELSAAAATLSARVVENAEATFEIRQEAARVAMVVEFEANRLSEALPNLKAHSSVVVDPPVVAGEKTR